MKKRLLKLGIVIVIFLFSISTFNIASADDHHFNKYYKHEKYEKHKDSDDDWDDDWDDKYEWKNKYKLKENNNLQTSQHSTSTYWNIWTRDTNVSVSSNLPLQEAKDVSFEVEGKNETLFVLPSNGQLLVSGEKMAKLLGVKCKFYSQSRILEISKGEEELIVRAGSNAAYENMVKTPMPTKAVYYEKTVYLPISVICNAFGYSVNWDSSKSTFILNKFN